MWNSELSRSGMLFHEKTWMKTSPGTWTYLAAHLVPVPDPLHHSLVAQKNGKSWNNLRIGSLSSAASLWKTPSHEVTLIPKPSPVSGSPNPEDQIAGIAPTASPTLPLIGEKCPEFSVLVFCRDGIPRQGYNKSREILAAPQLLPEVPAPIAFGMAALGQS